MTSLPTFLHKHSDQPGRGQAAWAPATHPLDTPHLTTRQQEVLGLLCEGLPDKIIARRLDLSHHTVRGHVRILYELLQVCNRKQATCTAHQHGLVLPQ